jgi:hypothetical protein
MVCVYCGGVVNLVMKDVLVACNLESPPSLFLDYEHKNKTIPYNMAPIFPI